MLFIEIERGTLAKLCVVLVTTIKQFGSHNEPILLL